MTWGFWRQKHGPVLISEKTSYRRISWSLEATRFVFRIVPSFWNLTGTSAALLPMCLSNFKAIRQFKVPISWLRDFTRSYEKTSFRILRRGPGIWTRINNCILQNTAGCNYLSLSEIPASGTRVLISSDCLVYWCIFPSPGIDESSVLIGMKYKYILC